MLENNTIVPEPRRSNRSTNSPTRGHDTQEVRPDELVRRRGWRRAVVGVVHGTCSAAACST
jgi:hypothetical protein